MRISTLNREMKSSAPVCNLLSDEVKLRRKTPTVLGENCSFYQTIVKCSREMPCT